ncbi:hypothetical protein PENTCL1PPCAC_21096, partial [Pristionchus entomophagus]
LQSIGESCVLLLVSFSYRLWSFSSSLKTGIRPQSRMRLLFICLLATIPAIITTVTTSNSPSSPPQSLIEHPELSGRRFSVFNLTASHLLSTENVLPRVSIGYIIFLYTVASPILFVLRRKLLQKISMLTASSEKQSHQLIFRSLTLQMFMPLSFSFGFVFWFLDFF